MNNRPGGGGGSNQQQRAYQPSDQEITDIIQSDDPVKSAEATVRCARQFGAALADRGYGLKASQIRNVFTAVRQIEMNWRVDAPESERKAAYRELLLLQPKLRYQAARETKVKPLADVLILAIQKVDSQDRGQFQRFVDFFEAILAYHRAEGGKE